MSSKIVVGVDGSDGSDRAVAEATEVAKRDGAGIVLVHVVERIAAKGDMAPVHADEEKIQEAVAAEADRLNADGLETSVETATVVLGGPARSIEEIAGAAGADLIVVGAKGRSAVAGLLLGSVPHRLLHIAKRPVLVVPSAG